MWIQLLLVTSDDLRAHSVFLLVFSVVGEQVAGCWLLVLTNSWLFVLSAAMPAPHTEECNQEECSHARVNQEERFQTDECNKCCICLSSDNELTRQDLCGHECICTACIDQMLIYEHRFAYNGIAYTFSRNSGWVKCPQFCFNTHAHTVLHTMSCI